MDEGILSAYSEARAEYMRQLLMHLGPAYFNFFLRLYDDAKTLTLQEPKKRLWQFQTLLAEIPDWNMERVRIEVEKFERDSNCDYLEDLLTAVFIAYTKVLTAIRLNTKNKRVNITVPKIEHFLFKALCECSRILWQNTFLFREDITNLQRQQNYREVEKLVHEGITQGVRSMTPVRTILKDCITDVGQDDEPVNDIPAQQSEIAGAAQHLEVAEALQHPEDTEDTAQHLEVAEDTAAAAQQETDNNEKVIDMNNNIANISHIEIENILQESSGEKEEKEENQEEKEENIIDATNTGTSVNFTNYNTVYTIDEPENTDIAYTEHDTESVDSFDLENNLDDLEFEDGGAIEADTLDDAKSVTSEMSASDYNTLE